MANDDKTRRGRAGEKVRPHVKTPDERPFDLWLQKQLHAMYDEIASEPLPNDLLKLIDQDAADARTTGSKTDDRSEPRRDK